MDIIYSHRYKTHAHKQHAPALTSHYALYIIHIPYAHNTHTPHTTNTHTHVAAVEQDLKVLERKVLRHAPTASWKFMSLTRLDCAAVGIACFSLSTLQLVNVIIHQGISDIA